jgi:subtilisin family serine protease
MLPIASTGMTTRFPLPAAIALAMAVWATPGPVQSQATSTDHDRSRIVVRLAPWQGAAGFVTKGNTGRPAFDRILDDAHVTSLRQIFPPSPRRADLQIKAAELGMHDYVVIDVPDGTDPDALLSTLTKSPDVVRAEFDVVARIATAGVTPDDPFFATHQYSLANGGTQPPHDPGTAGADIEMEAAWAIATGDTGTILAILDTGMDTDHPDLIGRLWINEGEEIDDFDNDGNGLIDDRFGWNFESNGPSVEDGHQHGTHVAGIAAAIGNNGIGVAGLNWNCQLMIIKVLGNDGSGSAAGVASGIEYATDMGADVISMSLGSSGMSSAESTAVAYAVAAGVVVVAASGNDGVGTPFYPAAFDGVVTVGATDSQDRRALDLCGAPGSNFAPYLDVCAPGKNIWSTIPTFIIATGCGPGVQTGYGNLSGTSMATPHVSGLASLIFGMRPDYTADSVKRLIRVSAEDEVGIPSEDTPGFDIYHGWGRINARVALQALAYDFPPIIADVDTQYVVEAETLVVAIAASDSNFTEPSLTMEPATNAMLIDHGDGTAEIVYTPDYSQAGTQDFTVYASDGSLADTHSVTVVTLQGCFCPCQGDPVCDSVTNVFDVVKSVDVAFRSGPPLIDESCFPHPSGRTDANCDSVTNVFDVVKFVDVAFRSAPAVFCDPCSP